MCGIAGIAGLIDNSDLRGRIEKMTERMAHRGPDASGHLVNSPVALGHRRLSIIDLSDAASQPITDPSGRYTIIYNGEVYNFLEIKEHLKGYEFQSNSDTDVILASYIKWGPSCVQKLNGMFAFAIWDEVEQELFIARDRLGIKPVYYHFQDGVLAFSSEVRSLLASGCVEARINRASLGEYLRYYSVNSPNTLIDGVFQLKAGNYGIWKGREWTTETYWHPSEIAPIEVSYEEARGKVQELLQDAVARRLMSDVPFGAFLSGGIDSSAIVALMARASEQPVNTFSIVFDEAEFDESRWSRLIADKYNTIHHPIKLHPQDFLEELPAALSAMDHPSGDGLNSYVVSQATRRKGFTVALSGLGGDELFAGYPVFKRYQKLVGMGTLYGIPAGLRSLAGKAVAGVYRNHKTARLQELIELERNRFRHLYPVFRKIYTDQEIERLLGAPSEATMSHIFSPMELESIEQMGPFSQVSVGEISTYTQNVLLRDTDQMSMAHSLEVRVPFFDHTLVEYALSLPDQVKEPVYPKKLLVDAMGDLLPHDLVHRKKMGFVFPWAEWLRNELADLCATRMGQLDQTGLFQPGEVRRIWERFEKHDKEIHWIKVWLLVVLQDWMEKNGVNV